MAMRSKWWHAMRGVKMREPSLPKTYGPSLPDGMIGLIFLRCKECGTPVGCLYVEGGKSKPPQNCGEHQ